MPLERLVPSVRRSDKRGMSPMRTTAVGEDLSEQQDQLVRKLGVRSGGIFYCSARRPGAHAFSAHECCRLV